MKPSIEWQQIAEALRTKLQYFEEGIIDQAELDSILTDTRNFCIAHWEDYYDEITASGINDLIEEMIWKINE